MCFGLESWIINPGVGGREFFPWKLHFFKNNDAEVSHDSDDDFGRVKTSRLALTLVIRMTAEGKGEKHMVWAGNNLSLIFGFATGWLCKTC